MGLIINRLSELVCSNAWRYGKDFRDQVRQFQVVLLLGTSQKAAADFTFLISVPVMFGASLLDLYDSRDLLSSDDLLLMLIGFATSFLVAMIAVVTFIKLIKRLRLEWFALYRFVLAALFYLIVIQ